MIIGIDGNEANIKNRVGVNQYAFELLCYIYKNLKNSPKKHRVIVFLKEAPLDDLPKESKHWQYKVLPGGGLWILTKLMLHLLKKVSRPDILFSPSHYLPFVCPVPMVCTIHDLGYLNFSGQFTKKDYWQLKVWTAISIYVSKAIISVSNSTKKDIVRHYPRVRDKIAVTLHGYDKRRFNNMPSLKDVRRIKDKYGIVNDYVLFLSTLKPSKNVEGVLEAFSEAEKRFSGLQLVIAGKKGWLYKPIFERVQKLGLSDKVTFTDYLPEKDKPALLKGARVFISPSFWEGFGIHVLEAMACGTPVVVSKVASLPEVVGNAGVYVDEKNFRDIAKGLIKILNLSKQRYNKLVSETISQANKFSWDDTAKKTLKILERQK